jgi:pyridoxal phosphate enzyme (YggS family)
MDSITDRVQDLRRKIEGAGGDPERVRVVAVTKAFGPEAVHAAVGAGVLDIGENYAQELVAKAPSAPAEARWHFLGRVQRNKVKALAPLVSCWQSVDRLALGEALAAHAPGASVLVQVNVTGEPDRNGCSWDEAPALVGDLRALALDVRGLMAVGPRREPGPAFRRLAALAADLGLDELSMGMSGDLEEAVAAGSTMVRVGAALFGPRPRPGDLRR